MTSAAAVPAARPAPPRRPRRGLGAVSLTPASSLALGVTMTWFSLLVLIPLAAVVATAAGGGWSGFWQSITSENVVAAIRLTVWQAFLVTLINAVMGTATAWVLVRYQFYGKRLLDVAIDIPFALPTIVAGLVLVSLYGDGSTAEIPLLGIPLDWATDERAITLAFLFVTLPFIVRTVQPVLEELDHDVEEAAASLGASRLTIFRRIILPSLTPAIAAGAALSFARAISEFGALVLLSSNLPNKTEVISIRVLSFIEGDDPAAAAAVATVMLAIALLVIVVLDILQRRVSRRG
ncbi:sulfate ABC transporter permease subunit CysT [Nocardioides speluncae]|uniref:sulfate ABC transporter permease subunit CysT n=1 Tax=Nocardioides speluncae TaxID=2670337 RepID=UPI000D68A99E